MDFYIVSITYVFVLSEREFIVFGTTCFKSGAEIQTAKSIVNFKLVLAERCLLCLMEMSIIRFSCRWH